MVVNGCFCNDLVAATEVAVIFTGFFLRTFSLHLVVSSTLKLLLPKRVSRRVGPTTSDAKIRPPAQPCVAVPPVLCLTLFRISVRCLLYHPDAQIPFGRRGFNEPGPWLHGIRELADIPVSLFLIFMFLSRFSVTPGIIGRSIPPRFLCISNLGVLADHHSRQGRRTTAVSFVIVVSPGMLPYNSTAAAVEACVNAVEMTLARKSLPIPPTYPLGTVAT